jgi:hypothetical protein
MLKNCYTEYYLNAVYQSDIHHNIIQNKNNEC